MNNLLLVLALLADSPATVAVQPLAVAACTAERLRPFVGPTGIRQSWPVVAELPDHLADGHLLSDQGLVADGYMQTLHVDVAAQAAFVVQQGGFAGLRTVYGPLPVSSCHGTPPNKSFKPTPLRGAA